MTFIQTVSHLIRQLFMYFFVFVYLVKALKPAIKILL